MLNDRRPRTADQEDSDDTVEVRELHALTPHQPLSSSAIRGRRPEPWEVGIHRSSTLSVGSEAENFTTISPEFNAMVVAESTIQTDSRTANLDRIRDEEVEESNPLAIVPDNNPVPSPRRTTVGPSISTDSNTVEEVSVHRVKKEEVESKISAWQTAEIAKINNRFKREDVVINGWESERVEKSTTWLKKVERKLDEKRARAMEKMQNDVARAHQKAEEKRASSEAKRGTKVSRVLELANLLRAVGRAPFKRSFFKLSIS